MSAQGELPMCTRYRPRLFFSDFRKNTGKYVDFLHICQFNDAFCKEKYDRCQSLDIYDWHFQRKVFQYKFMVRATYSAIFTGTALPMACSIDDVVPANSNDSGNV